MRMSGIGSQNMEVLTNLPGNAGHSEEHRSRTKVSKRFIRDHMEGIQGMTPGIEASTRPIN